MSFAIGRLARQIAKVNDDHLRQAGITASQLPVLVSLKYGERRTQIELARLAEVEQPSMAQLLSRMERDGLIAREPAPGDRRSSLIFLTDKALHRLEPGREALRAVEAAVCDGLTAAELELLDKLILHIAENLERAAVALERSHQTV